MTREEIGATLKALRIKSGKTQKEVAKALGRTQQIVGHWETGYSQPDANTLFTLCEVYGTTVDEAFGFRKKTVSGYSVSLEDYKRIKKYKDLDDIGRNHVDIILEWESNRVNQLKEFNSNNIVPYRSKAITPMRLISYYYKNASAGTGELMMDPLPEKDIEIPDIPEYRNVSYAIGVNGDSMEPIYHDGDVLLVEATGELKIGDIGIFLVNNECYVKQMGETELISLNKDYANIPLNESARIWGKVIDTYTPA